MKILAINNYSLKKAYELSLKGLQPPHHCWGVDYFRENGDKVDTKEFRYHYKNKIAKALELLCFNLKLILIAKRYDVVIAFAHPLIPFLALLKKCGFFQHTRLYTIVHHTPRFRLNGYNKVFFISNRIKEKTEKRYPEIRSFSKYITWGGDPSFYRKKSSTFNNHVVVSNGKTMRDNELLITACLELGIKYLIITDKIDNKVDKNIISSRINGKNALSYKDMIDFSKDATICAIPIVDSLPEGMLCGLTSFIDGCLMGCPLLLSDNSNIGVDIENEQMGYFFKAGDLKSMKEKLSLLYSNDNLYKNMSSNCLKYGREHDYLAYCKELRKEISEMN